MVAGCCNAEFLSAVLVNPSHIQPVFRYRVVGADEVKSFRVDTERMTERFGMAAQQEVERLNLIRTLLPSVKTRQWSHNSWTADCRTTDGGKILKGQR